MAGMTGTIIATATVGEISLCSKDYTKNPEKKKEKKKSKKKTRKKRKIRSKK